MRFFLNSFLAVCLCFTPMTSSIAQAKLLESSMSVKTLKNRTKINLTLQNILPPANKAETKSKKFRPSSACHENSLNFFKTQKTCFRTADITKIILAVIFAAGISVAIRNTVKPYRL